MEIYVGFLFSQRFFSSSVLLHACRKLLKLHDITGEGSCLIEENIFDLAQFFIEITGLSFHSHILFIVEHENLVVHVHGLPKLNKLQWYRQWNRNKISEHKDPSCKFR